QGLVAPHVGSFDFFVNEGLPAAVADLPPHEFQAGEGGPTVRLWYAAAAVGYPTSRDDGIAAGKSLLPRECRERGLTYSAALSATVCFQVDGGDPQRVQRRFGECPVMVRSARCQLREAAPARLAE
ncbi:unnamed protein product, partial [Phaeothamnion confervicola]